MKYLFILLLFTCSIGNAQGFNRVRLHEKMEERHGFKSIKGAPFYNPARPLPADTLIISDSIIARWIESGPKRGLTYVRGLLWSGTFDKVDSLFIQGDTMTVMKNLLIYCLQEKRENDNAGILTVFKNRKEFEFYLKEYRKEVRRAKNVQKHPFFTPFATLLRK